MVLAGCEGSADVVFIIDKSGSIRHEKFGEVQQFINAIIEQLEVMADLHCRTRIWIQIRIRIPNPVATWYCAETFHIGLDPDSDPFPIVFV